MARKEIILLLNYLENKRGYLSPIQFEYITSLKKHYQATDVLTKSQVEWLYEMKEFIPSHGLKKAVNETESENYQAQYSSFDHFSAYRL
jgi:hypothetical protein